MKTAPSIDRPLPAGSGIGWGLFAAALALYAATLAPTPFPGLPAAMLWERLGGETPPGAAPLWSWLVRGMGRLPGGWPPLAASAFAAFCGAACVGLLAWLMGQVRYRGLMVDKTDARFRCERRARRVSSLAAGLYLACGIPFWVASTRSLPATFHLLLLLSAACLFSLSQQRGTRGPLLPLGLLYGVGLAEHFAFVLFLPLAAVLLLRDWHRRGVWADWRRHAAFWGACAFGFSIQPLHVLAMRRFAPGAGGGADFWGAWAQALGDQIQQVLHVRFNPGFLALMVLTAVPWLLVFVFSRRAPWHYDTDQIVVRMAVAAALLAVLFNAPFSFWNFLGMRHLMLTPHLLLAACMGFMVGEFWILGAAAPASDPSIFRRGLRRSCRALAFLLPAAILLAGARNWAVADARPARRIHEEMADLLARLPERPILFTDGLLDTSLHLAARERGEAVLAVDVLQLTSPVYLRRLARSVPAGPLRDVLLKGDADPFVEALLLSDESLGRVALFDLTDYFRDFAYLLPDGPVHRTHARLDEAEVRALGPRQADFRRRMERLAAARPPPGNLVEPFRRHMLAWAAKAANNLGVRQIEAGDWGGARESFRFALRANPSNWSAWMNALDLARREGDAELEDLESQWAARLDEGWASRWSLAAIHGYLWNARDRVREGHGWALTGEGVRPEAARRRPSAPAIEDRRRVQFLDMAYGRWGEGVARDYLLFARLFRDDRDVGVMRELARNALRRGDAEAADAYLSEAFAAGLGGEDGAFDRAMVEFVRGGPEAARSALLDIVRRPAADVRPWLALALLEEDAAPEKRRSLRELQELAPASPGELMALAWVHLFRREWDAARSCLERAIRSDPRNRAAWEMLFSLARASDNRSLAAVASRHLLEQDPLHPLKIIQEALERVQRGDSPAAEEALRQAIGRQRHPDLLHVLARLLEESGGDADEIARLHGEALAAEPYQFGFRLERARHLLDAGRPDEAAADLRILLEDRPDHVEARWLEMRRRADDGDRDGALREARALAARHAELSPSQKDELRRMVGEWQHP